MMSKTVFLFILFGAASSKLRFTRICDPVPVIQVEPTDCSNYENTVDLDTRLEKLEKEVSRTKSDLENKATEISTLQEAVQRLSTYNTEIQKRLNSTEQQLQNTIGNAKDNVAFSATLIDPYSQTQRTDLIFSKVVTNVGNAFSLKTGIFVAPVEGVYHFFFMVTGNNNINLRASLAKNGFCIYWTILPADHDSTNWAVNLELNKGDRVNVRLWPQGVVSSAVFSGFRI
ncbi:cerebellin 11 [Thalassophryne amazonica]|uniref:cerebellin 11 n=1 Tax=Thalassophryne amazonica TaxID=390379 RepID=UPI0014710DCE|nr:cerebellin 11 [Thalassophryne amazonica]